jgi:hypothetical protein
MKKKLVAMVMLLTLVGIFALNSTDEASDPSIFDSPALARAAIRSRPATAQTGGANKHSADAELLSQLAQSQDAQARKDAAENLGKSWSEAAVEPLGGALAGERARRCGPRGAGKT